MNYQFSRTGNPEIAKYLKDEIAAQVIAATTLAYNRWETVAGRKHILRGTGGFSLLTHTNRIILQCSGEGMLYLDEFDIKDIFNRAIAAIQKHRKFDFENAMEAEPSISIGRLDSQITIAIPVTELTDFFSFSGKEGSGRIREFKQVVGGKEILTGKYWLKNPEPDIYLLTPDELKKAPQTNLKKRDFVRIYDKILEVIETTIPHSEKRSLLIEKYAPYMGDGQRIFRIEVQEMDRGLTRHIGNLFDEDKLTFCDISQTRMKRFADRNPFKMWTDLLSQGPKPSAIDKSGP